ncbi:MAG: TIR domain-containing protein [Prevotella sp.]|nr:TIR domain-containing protein [Prevotella sp.]
MLSYRTRANSSPQGKQKVFFSSVPEDFSAFFEGIAVTLLKCADCAIWYNEEDNYEDIEIELSEMSLFVIPVTTKLLTSKNRTITVDLPFALKHHIPVLPLLMERGLDDVYQKSFGNMHFLSIEGEKKPGNNFHERCKQYVQSILFNNIVIERVRKAFDSYIFISYRKKDRKHAQDLMRLIHENDFCRDIAVWYDEYLIPGEDFNVAIEKALCDCELISLVVTPNLYNEKNYVQSVEYPLAKQAGKKLLPVEMQSIQKDELALYYPGLGEIITRDRVSETLVELIGGNVRQESVQDPEHNYFIGLAYLRGIDVERNTERGLGLIQAAAQCGVVEAIRTLVDIYENGDGVRRDNQKAIQWQKELVARLSVNASEGSCEEYLHSVCHLGDQYMSIGEPQNAKPVYQELYELSAKFKAINDDMSSYVLLAVDKMGDADLALGDIEIAKVKYTKVLKDREKEVRETKSREARRELARSYDKLGDIKMCEVLSSEILLGPSEYDEALKIRESLIAEDDNVDDLLELSYSLKHVVMGYSVFFPREAERLCLRALEIDEKLFRDMNTPKTKENLSECYMLLGDIYMASKDRKSVEDYYKKALRIIDDLVFETEQLSARRSLAALIEKIGDFYVGYEDQKAVDCYYRSTRIRKDILDDTSTIESILSFSGVSKKLMCFYKGKDAWMIAEYLLEINERFVSNKDLRIVRVNVLALLNELAEIKEKEGCIDEAESFYLKRLDRSEQFMSEEDLPAYRKALCESLTALSEIKLKKNDRINAQRYKLRVIRESWPFVSPDATGLAGIFQARDYYECATMTDPYDFDILKEAYEYCDESYRFFNIDEYKEIRDKIKDIIG